MPADVCPRHRDRNQGLSTRCPALVPLPGRTFSFCDSTYQPPFLAVCHRISVSTQTSDGLALPDSCPAHDSFLLGHFPSHELSSARRPLCLDFRNASCSCLRLFRRSSQPWVGGAILDEWRTGVPHPSRFLQSVLPLLRVPLILLRPSGRDGTSLPKVNRPLPSRLRQEAQETDHEVGGVAYGALGRKFLRLDQFLKSTSAKAEENVPNPKLFQ